MYIDLNSSLCNFLHSPLTSSIFQLGIYKPPHLICRKQSAYFQDSFDTYTEENTFYVASEVLKAMVMKSIIFRHTMLRSQLMFWRIILLLS
jgi:hypothetical protein